MQQQVRRFTDTHLRGGDRLVRYSAVYGAYAGSIPVRRATSSVPVVQPAKGARFSGERSWVQIPPGTPWGQTRLEYRGRSFKPL